ncbi:DegT/DnrJ/EryC1/StrS family aminotransferase [Planomonospora parontospora]|uniref:DegT/DnrJ/EryC1/StrS family aminotransferase n=1 Tax=Planomonospora parontospora TaxID=58119 RepID=UPI0016705489|nr:DegT/DnrJ/EryC1/StrS family aminotransferase [Planomonospora parontospora]GGL42417.1 hypothetical protein GCM10014719_49670 [Planomonospora parontospora subsp. antibiotica]GII18394.1 hypothetical protein Ppa05_51200 [Planomonospora parontospora subsp. antibiotica]
MRRRELELRAAESLGCERAAVAASGCAAVLALTSCLAAPGRTVLMPGWICSGVVHAVLLAGMRPALVDVDEAFLMSTAHADMIAASTDVGLVLYAPYGGHAPDMETWRDWSARHGVSLVIDLAQTPDTEVWRQAAVHSTVLVSSFRSGKPLGGAGGGVVAGGADIVEDVRTFLNGGKDDHGRKIAFGLELHLHDGAVRAALSALTLHGRRMDAWRTATREALRDAGSALPPGWRKAAVALSRFPRLDGRGKRLHPDTTFGDRAWRRTAADRLGPWSDPPLPRLGKLYDRVTVTKIQPHRDGGDDVTSATSEEVQT